MCVVYNIGISVADFSKFFCPVFIVVDEHRAKNLESEGAVNLYCIVDVSVD